MPIRFTSRRLHSLDQVRCREAIAEVGEDDTALLLYTSGTTGKPKGARLTHQNVATQAALLRDAWGMVEGDSLLHALPLHHLHGLGISLLSVLLESPL